MSSLAAALASLGTMRVLRLPQYCKLRIRGRRSLPLAMAFSQSLAIRPPMQLISAGIDVGTLRRRSCRNRTLAMSARRQDSPLLRSRGCSQTWHPRTRVWLTQ